MAKKHLMLEIINMVSMMRMFPFQIERGLTEILLEKFLR